MRPICFATVLGLSLALAAIAQDVAHEPKVSSESLTKEQVIVYRAVLQDFLKDSTDTLKLANTTEPIEDRKSTRLNSSHGSISYAVFCLKKKKKKSLTIKSKQIKRKDIGNKRRARKESCRAYMRDTHVDLQILNHMDTSDEQDTTATRCT